MSPEIVWSSEVTDQMIKHLSDNEVSLLFEALNDAVMQVCQNYDIDN